MKSVLAHRPSKHELSLFTAKRESDRGLLTVSDPDSASSRSRSQDSASAATMPGMPLLPVRPRARKPRSQYPLGSSERHVEYILVASFDVDRGPSMEHQYPGPISGDEHMLAELMLPDQAHARSQDWTIFFLHKDGSEAKSPEKERTLDLDRRRQRSEDAGRGKADGTSDGDDSDESEGEGVAAEGPPLIYVLNLVNTKHDVNLRRGGMVKSMAVCTRHPFLHIYKPLLLLALEEYFRFPVPETLASFYNAVNSMDLSLMPRLSLLERIILKASDDKDLFIEKFQQMILQRMAEQEEEGSSDDFVIARAASPNKGRDSKYTLPRDTHEFETKVSYNGFHIPVKIPVATSSEIVGDFSLINLINTFSEPHRTSPQPFVIHPHLTTSGPYTHPIIVLINALLTQKRVVFLGHNCPSSVVADTVLAACTLASGGGVLRGFTRHAFPYTDLSKITDLLRVPGFVAGVTNPTFTNKPEWWDLLCDLSSGRMKISSSAQPAPITDGLTYFQHQHPVYVNGVTAGSQPTQSASILGLGVDNTGDTQFMEEINRSIALRHGEAVIRTKFRAWTVKFTRIAAAFEESVYGTTALFIGGEKADIGAAAYGLTSGSVQHGYVWSDEASRQLELAANVSRIEGWRNTRSYYNYILDMAKLYKRQPIASIDLHHHHDRLRTQRLSHAESAAIYLAFSKIINSPTEINQLLTVTPASHAGLFYISLGLFHPYERVRKAVVALLERVKEHQAGRHFWERLGRFAKMAEARIRVEMMEGQEKEGEEGNGSDLGEDREDGIRFRGDPDF